jgi:hypothetical protein
MHVCVDTSSYRIELLLGLPVEVDQLFHRVQDVEEEP